MPDLPPDLDAAVRDQAEARAAMNIQGYAKYLTPEAVDTLRASFPGIPPRVSGYDISSVSGSGSDYTVEVRYKVRDAGFVVRSRWRRADGEWGVVHAERLWAEGEARPGLLSRIAASLLAPFARRRR
jgi:uncharacterized protein YgiB involved in biofilm formation